MKKEKLLITYQFGFNLRRINVWLKKIYEKNWITLIIQSVLGFKKRKGEYFYLNI